MIVGGGPGVVLLRRSRGALRHAPTEIDEADHFHFAPHLLGTGTKPPGRDAFDKSR